MGPDFVPPSASIAPHARPRFVQRPDWLEPLVPLAPSTPGVTLPMVLTMLQQVELDAATSYWSTGEHRTQLEAARAWLHSLRDWIETMEAKRSAQPESPEHGVNG